MDSNLRCSAHGLDLMAIEIAHKRRVIGVGIFRPQAWFAVSLAASLKRCMVKCIDIVPPRGAERDMSPTARAGVFPARSNNPEQQPFTVWPGTIGNTNVARKNALVAKRCQGSVVKSAAGLKVGAA